MTTQTLEAPEFVSSDGKLSADFWANMPETKPYYELIEGVLQRKSLKAQREIHAVCQMAFQLMNWGEAKNWVFYCEGTGIKADKFNGYMPDMIGFAPGTTLDPDAVYDESAFLIGEVRSTSSAQKRLGYARAEVEIYILIDPQAKTFEVYRLNGDAYGAPEALADGAVWQAAEFAGLRLELAKLWM